MDMQEFKTMLKDKLVLLKTFKFLCLTFLWMYLFSECGVGNIILIFIAAGSFSAPQSFLFVDYDFGSSTEGIQTESSCFPEL